MRLRPERVSLVSSLRQTQHRSETYMKLSSLALTALLSFPLAAPQVMAQAQMGRDDFFWLGEINKATAVINTEEGLLDKSMTPRFTAGIAKVLKDGNQPGGKRPIERHHLRAAADPGRGPEITLLHAGRSSQDMHATYRAAILRDDMLNLADQLNKTTASLVKLAAKHADTIVPNYTNGVAAQPNSLGHYLLGHAAGLDRDAQRIREAYARIDRSPMGTTVLNGTSWPLNRKRMADYLGFAAMVDNAYDAAQISSMDEPVEAARHRDQHRAAHRPLRRGRDDAVRAGAAVDAARPKAARNTYVSSAMPQKRNPGLLNSHPARRFHRGDAGAGRGRSRPTTSRPAWATRRKSRPTARWSTAPSRC